MCVCAHTHQIKTLADKLYAQKNRPKQEVIPGSLPSVALTQRECMQASNLCVLADVNRFKSCRKKPIESCWRRRRRKSLRNSAACRTRSA